MPDQHCDMENSLSPESEFTKERYVSSAPGSRSNSWKSRHRVSLIRDKAITNLVRGNSASTPDCSNSTHRNFLKNDKSCPLCTVRSFKTTCKGIVDSGSFCKALSSNSLFSSGSLATSSNYRSGSRPKCSKSVDRERAGSVDSSDGSDDTPSICVTASYFRTLVLGATGVGKTSLVHQLTQSGSSSTVNDDEVSISSFCSGSLVNVELDGQESTMEFIDGADMSELECYRADAFLVMYAVSEPQSYTTAVSLIRYLRQELGTDRTIIMVANKTDLVRQRHVPFRDAKSVAKALDCHFIETSTVLNVNLDQLLVSTLCSIVEQLTPIDAFSKTESKRLRYSSKRRHRSAHGALSAISSFLKQACKRENKSSSVHSLVNHIL